MKMTMMRTWIKQHLCRHVYKPAGGGLVHENAHYIVPKTALECEKCGKIIWR